MLENGESSSKEDQGVKLRSSREDRQPREKNKERTENKKTETRRKPLRVAARCGRTNEPGLRRVRMFRESLAARYFVDAIRDEDTRNFQPD
ncbi:hypothetical protein AVEN_166041-1 [Araneus ventricosus]|uniref:Uncharacterized protein n=1 Tax=Araneus ventricosus TaxID=182803 RepID=A0A4Y2STY6_ARAVE|nr:hypothetical protein AVEN_166041-1 [Araneus ventricosus]